MDNFPYKSDTGDHMYPNFLSPEQKQLRKIIDAKQKAYIEGRPTEAYDRIMMDWLEAKDEPLYLKRSRIFKAHKAAIRRGDKEMSQFYWNKILQMPEGPV